jgi:hypothetical protein
MSKYIPQLNETNFVFPNYELSEYDVDIIHNINDFSVSGTVTNFVVSGTARTTGITFTYSATWNKNNADVFIRQSGRLGYLSIHMIAAGQTYYKPWRLVSSASSSDIASTVISLSNINFTVTPSQVGLTSFSSGTYYFEFRFIGLKSIYPICQTLSITVT